VTLAKCPLCGHSASFSVFAFVECDNSDCHLIGPNNETGDGAKWNALAALSAKARAFDAARKEFDEAVNDASWWCLQTMDEALEKERVAIGLPPVEEVKG